ncbi:MAG: class I SAM-dependent methyltransferase [Xanthobacteraceae bacterium]
MAALRQQIAGADERALLLGTTEWLADVAPDVTAIDKFEPLIRGRWPGNTIDRRIVAGEWLRLPFATESFTCCVGDGSINSLRFPRDVAALFESVARVLKPGGRFACRVYAAPETGLNVSEVTRAVWTRAPREFLYFKFQLAMAFAAEHADPNVRVQSIRDLFDSHFPDRDRLSEATGWGRAEIDKIDLYNSSPEIYSFPTERQVLSLIPASFVNARFERLGTYDFAERCPILIADRT